MAGVGLFFQRRFKTDLAKPVLFLEDFILEDFMRKILVLSAVLFTAITIETHAFGVGIQGGLNVLGGPSGLSFLISSNEQTHGAITYYFGDEGMKLGGSLDYWFVHSELVALGPGSLYGFVGIGAYAQIEAWTDHFGLAAGLRLPFGLDWNVGPFDVFLQIVPLTGLALLPSPGFDGFHVDANIGARFWIN
jgi:hypothetical protein